MPRGIKSECGTEGNRRTGVWQPHGAAGCSSARVDRYPRLQADRKFHFVQRPWQGRVFIHLHIKTTTNLFLLCSASSHSVFSWEPKHLLAASRPVVRSPPRPCRLSVPQETQRTGEAAVRSRISQTNHLRSVFTWSSDCSESFILFISLTSLSSPLEEKNLELEQQKGQTWRYTSRSADVTSVTLSMCRILPVLLHGEVITWRRAWSRHLPVSQLFEYAQVVDQHRNIHEPPSHLPTHYQSKEKKCSWNNSLFICWLLLVCICKLLKVIQWI